MLVKFVDMKGNSLGSGEVAVPRQGDNVSLSDGTFWSVFGVVYHYPKKYRAIPEVLVALEKVV